MNDADIRPFRPADLPAVQALIDATALFPSELLDGMVPTRIDNASDEADAGFWLLHDDGGPNAVAYCNGTWNLLMRHVEDVLGGRGARVLLVETSGTDGFERTRGFCRHLGYDEEARIREYYDVGGDDKVVFRKVL